VLPPDVAASLGRVLARPGMRAALVDLADR
jgi:hypothetical protein